MGKYPLPEATRLSSVSLAGLIFSFKCQLSKPEDSPANARAAQAWPAALSGAGTMTYIFRPERTVQRAATGSGLGLTSPWTSPRAGAQVQTLLGQDSECPGHTGNSRLRRQSRASTKSCETIHIYGLPPSAISCAWRMGSRALLPAMPRLTKSREVLGMSLSPARLKEAQPRASERSP